MPPQLAPIYTGRPPASPSFYSPYANFHLPSSSSDDGSANGNGGNNDDENGYDDDDGDDLPFPTALARKDFLAPDFDAIAYLSALFPTAEGTTSAQRHQTLEDLRSELRERSSAIGAELLELVNANYTSFLGLGDELRGGEDKIEDVRVALFGFRRSVEDVQKRVRDRKQAVSEGCLEYAEVRRAIDTGRQLLELDERIELLERRLAVDGSDNAVAAATTKSNSANIGPWELEAAEIWDSEEEEEEEGDDDEGEDEDDKYDGDKENGTAAAEKGRGAGADDNKHNTVYVGTAPAKLLSMAHDLVQANLLAEALGRNIPLVRKAEERLAQCHTNLVLDLNNALKEVRRGPRTEGSKARSIKLLAVYRVLGDEEEAIRALKEA